MKPRFSLLVALVFLVATGCQKSQPHQDTVIVQGYKLIDSNRSDEAIILLEAAVKADPKNADTLIALSSAYAAYAGVSVPTLFPVIEKSILKKDFINTLKEFKSSKADLLGPKGTKSSYDKARALASSWMDLMNLLSMSFNSFNLLPDVSREKTQYLRQAISIAESISPQKKGYGLYAAVLRVVLFKNDLIHDSLPKVMHDDDAGVCRLNLSTIPDFANGLQDSVDRIFTDLKTAFPRQSGSYDKLSLSLRASTASISMSATGLDALNDVSSALSFKLGVEQVLGRAFSCGKSAAE